MRTRDLKPAFFRDEEIVKLPPITRLLYQGLWCRSDRRGRQTDVVGLIKADIFPLENVAIEKHLTLLVEAKKIVRYEADGKRCIYIPAFLKNQHPHPKEPESVLPPAPAEQGQSNVHVTAEPLPFRGEAVADTGQSRDPSASHSNLSPLTSIPSNALASNSPATLREHPLNFNDAEWREIVAAYKGHNVQALWREWVSWIEEEEEERRPKNKRIAFEGWVDKKVARKTAAATR